MSRLITALVTLTFAVVFVWGTLSPSQEKRKDVLKPEDRENMYDDEKKISQSVTNEVRYTLESESADDLWMDDAISAEDADDILLPHFVEKSTVTKNFTKKSTLLLVSTLDGTLSALDATNDGNILWKIETGPGSLLSSSISKVELNSHGKLVRLIPSLDGGLYKFDGEGIEPIPISADSLLHSSYRAADDLLITGGKEVRTYGIDAQTGHLQYSCSAEGCHVEPAEAGSSGEFLIIRRHSQIVRAIEPRTGTERWNFSVGRHEASLLHGDADSFTECKADNLESPEEQMECIFKNPVEEDHIGTESDATRLNPTSLEYKVVVPDGVVCAIHPQRTGHVLWKYKFDSPVVHVWQLKDGSLTPLDLFNADFVPALENKPEIHEEPKALSSPLLYVGIHKNQLYVQESRKMIDYVKSPPSNHASNEFPSSPSSSIVPLRVHWQPLSANSMIAYEGRPGRFTTSVMLSRGSPSSSDENESFEQSNDPAVTALIVRHETDFSGDRGFYLFRNREFHRQNSKPTSKSVDHEESSFDPFDELEDEEWWEGGKNTPVHIVIVSLSYWWREVVFISLLTALIFHVVITRQVVKLLQQRWAIELHRHISAVVPPLARLTGPENQIKMKQASLLENPSDNVEVVKGHSMESVVVQSTKDPAIPAVAPYISRYLTDFEPIQCLGRGGFGLVFEVRNRLDDCHYAVKRIQLPNSEEAREKVMREVKALAKLDNPHIVRYFHAWIECPPPGWQESQDAAWIDSESITGPTPFNTGEESSVSKLESSGFTSSDEESIVDRLRLSKAISSIDSLAVRRKSLTNDDSSFDIVFEYSSQKCQDTSSETTPLKQIQDDSKSCSKKKNSAIVDTGFEVIKKTSGVGMKRFHRDLHRACSCPIADAKMFLFIQMQLCRKESLREWLRAHVSHRDTHQVLHMFNEIVRAVEYVHLQGLIHRDLKPSNIFFAPDGAIKIGDFGLVTAMAEEAYFHSPMSHEANGIGPGTTPFQRTHTDQVGTQMYMSPEQIEGKPYSHKVDIYSLGLILVELLWPLATQMEQVTVISQLRKLKLPQGFNEKYPEEAILLNKMLSRNPDERPTTFGIRASSPLKGYQDPTVDIPEYLHFNLQRQRSATRTSSTSSS